MSFLSREDIERFYRWLEPKWWWQLAIAGAVGLGLLGIWAYLQFTKPAGSSSGQGGGYRYPGLPEVCYCPSCGYEIRNPGRHCPELGPCPRCGAPRLWRKK